MNITRRDLSLTEILSVICVGLAVTVAGLMMLALLPVAVAWEWWRLR